MVGESRLGVISYRRYEKMLYRMSSSLCLSPHPPPLLNKRLIEYGIPQDNKYKSPLSLSLHMYAHTHDRLVDLKNEFEIQPVGVIK